MQVLKRCRKCQLEKELSEFRKQSKNKDGLQYACRLCMDNLAKIRYEADKHRIICQVREWQAKNPDMVKGYRLKNLAKRKSPKISQV